MVEDKQRQIIEGVWGVIVEQGISAVSMRSVAAAAEVSVGRVQHHFGTKTELVRASVTEMLDAAAEENAQATADPADPATLWSLLAHSLEPAEQSRAGVSVFYAYLAAGVTDPWIAERLAHTKRAQTQHVAECLARQYPHLADPALTARQLVALADGCTQAVYLGHATADEAMAVLREALDRLDSHR